MIKNIITQITNSYKDAQGLMIVLDNGTKWCFVDEPLGSLVGRKVIISKPKKDYLLKFIGISTSYVVTEF